MRTHGKEHSLTLGERTTSGISLDCIGCCLKS